MEILVFILQPPSVVQRIVDKIEKRTTLGTTGVEFWDTCLESAGMEVYRYLSGLYRNCVKSHYNEPHDNKFVLLPTAGNDWMHRTDQGVSRAAMSE